MALFAPSSNLRRIIVPEAPVQSGGVASADIPVATFSANSKFLITRFSAVVYSAQTTIGASTLTGPTVRLIFGPAGNVNTNAFASLVITSTVNAVNDLDATAGQGAYRIITDANAFSLVVRCTAPGTRYTNFSCGFIVEGFAP